MVRRLTLALTLLLVFALAVPASAATWRYLGVAKSVGYKPTSESAFAGLDATARNVKKVQVGLWQNSGRTRTLTSDHHIVCSRAGGAVEVKERIDTKRTVDHARWKWITIWNRPVAWDSCQIYANGFRPNHFAAIRVKTRVQ